MNREQLLAYLDKAYPGWWRKLRFMPTSQLYAIYCHVREAKAKKPKEPKKSQAPMPPQPVHFIYECQACYAQYEADNPDESECRFCGTPRPIKYDRRRRVS